MGSNVDIALVRSHYRSLTDQEFLHVITRDASKGLSDEAMMVVREEAKLRNIDPELLLPIEAMNRRYSRDDMDAYCRVIATIACPTCGGGPVTIVSVSEVMSFIIFTQYRKKPLMGCRACLTRVNNTALYTSLLLGWWGFPWGPIRTVSCICNYITTRRDLKQDGFNDQMRQFVLDNIGIFGAYGHDEDAILGIMATVDWS